MSTLPRPNLPASTSTTPTGDEFAERVAAFMTASGAGARVGPFTVHFDDHTANVWRNYAVPDIGATPGDADVAALIDVFERRDRTPRLEYLPSAAPAVEPVLLAAGFTTEFRPPVFGCRRGEASALDAPDGITFSLVTDEADLLDAVRVQNSAYGEPSPAGPADVARLAALNARGGLVALAREASTAAPVGSALCENPCDGVSELAAVGVVDAYRRQGIGSALTAFLARAMLSNGAELLFLEREPHVKDRMYELAGFTRTTEKLWISRLQGVIAAGPVRLHPISAGQARAIIDGDLDDLPRGLTPAAGWPHQDTAAGMWMVANKGVEGWIISHDGWVIGDAGALLAAGEATFAFTLAEQYRDERYPAIDLRTTISTALADALRSRPGTRSVMDGSRASADRQPPALAAGERETLLAFVGYLRECLIAKLEGLSEADARRSAVDSGTSPLGLVKHVASMEHAWVAYSFAGGDADDIPSGGLARGDTIGSVVAAARSVGVRTTEIVTGCDDLDRLATVAYGSSVRTLRWILVHLVEEIGRHAGHADILREQIDGATGR